MMLAEAESEGIFASAETSRPITPKTKRWISGEAAVSSHADDIRKRVLSFTTQKPTLTMVIEAVTAVGINERGASVQAIMKWIIANYAVLDLDKVKILIKKAILKALQKGVIERSETSKGCLGPFGSFVIGKNKNKNSSSARKRKMVKSSILKQKIKEKSLENGSDGFQTYSEASTDSEI